MPRPLSCDVLICTALMTASHGTVGVPSEPTREEASRICVGRARELAELADAVARVGRGRGRLLLLAGEPGIGKTTLAEEVARQARALGHVVAWGRAWQAGGAPAFWPWCEALSSILRQRPNGTEVFDDETAALAHILPAHLLPESRAALQSGTSNPEQARFAMFVAVRTLLERCSARQPLVLLFEDLHAADRASLLLLEFICNGLGSRAMLVLGTYREVEAGLDPDLSRIIAHVGRFGSTLRLGRLDTVASTELVHAEAPDVAGPALERLLELAAGNPLFLAELLRRCLADPLAFESRHAELPHGIREVIQDRLAHLPGHMRPLLEVGAVIGDEFELSLVAAMSGADRARLDEFVQLGVRAGILEERGPSRLRFGHSLYRDAVYRALPLSRRSQLHGAVADALEVRSVGHPLRPWAELSHHALLAAPEGTERAVEYTILAAEDSFSRLAYDDALSVLELAHAMLKQTPGYPQLHGEILLARGSMRMRIGDTMEGQALCQQAAGLAEALGDAELLARAALGYGSTIHAGMVDPVLVRLLTRAHDQLAEGDVKLRLRVMTRLAAAQHPGPQTRQSLRLARESITLARQLDDEHTLLNVLDTSLSVLLDFVDPNERLPLDHEMAALALALGDRERRLRAFSRLVFDHAELGDFSAVIANIEVCERLAEELNLQHLAWRPPLFRSMLALATGDFAAADVHISHSEQLAAANADAARCLRLHRNGRLYTEERLFELATHIDTDVRRLFEELGPQQASFAPLFGGWVASRREDLPAARTAWASLPAEGWQWDGDPAPLLALGEMAACVGDRERAELLYQRLMPSAGRDVSWGIFACLWEGPVDRGLALLAECLGRTDAASRHFESALERLERLGARPYLARTRYEYARALIARGQPSDATRAQQLLEAAEQLANELGQKDLLALIARRLKPLDPGRSTTPDPHSHIVTLAREGDLWRLCWEGPELRLKDSRGLGMLARLLAEPGREFHARDLASGAPPAGLVPHVDGDAGEQLDERARKAYAARLADIDAELTEAESFHDLHRAERLAAEKEFIAQELSRAIGLGGRPRRAKSVNERARTSVQRRLRDAIARITESVPSLGQRLQEAVHTGTFCAYRPPPLAAGKPIEAWAPDNPATLQQPRPTSSAAAAGLGHRRRARGRPSGK